MPLKVVLYINSWVCEDSPLYQRADGIGGGGWVICTGDTYILEIALGYHQSQLI